MEAKHRPQGLGPCSCLSAYCRLNSYQASVIPSPLGCGLGGSQLRVSVLLASDLSQPSLVSKRTARCMHTARIHWS